MENPKRNILAVARPRFLIGVLVLASLLAGCVGISGYQIVQNKILVTTGRFENVRVDCPSGKKVLGGGFSIETPDDVKVFTSEPSDGQGNLSDHSWNVFVHNAGGQTRQTTAIAICAAAQ